ncbi:MAG: transporter permease [Burkholderiales bacterium]|jgi:zinc/manganese transport system permease protein|nr:transporter permease [Burkholderiales bacterium]
MWAYDFMQNAVLAGIIVATICGIVSVFVVIRRSAFAAHALSHMSLTGAALGMLLGFSAIIGQLVVNLIAALTMGFLGDKIKKNDLAIGVVLTFVLGLGAYFLFLFQNNYSGGVLNILFGNILAVSKEQIYLLIGLSVGILSILAICARPLLFASIDPTLAEAKNLPIRFLSIIFFCIIAVTVSMACQIVGALLIFVLLIIPGAIAGLWCDGFYKTILVSVLVANISIFVSLCIAYQFNLPTSFCITTLMSLIYAISHIKSQIFKS